MTTAALTELSLFSGAGGGLLASKHLLGWKTLGYVEINEYCQKVIAQRIKDGLLDEAPIFTDIKAFNRDGYAESYQGMVDVVSGGFPCQDISCAGKGAGIRGEKSGLWFEMQQAIGIIRPRFVFLENSPLIVSRGLALVLCQLAEMGYSSSWGIIGADTAGLPQKRDRFYLVADSMPWDGSMGRDLSGGGGEPKQTKKHLDRSSKSEPPMVGMVDGLAHRLDRLRAIGNGQVPIVAATAWEILSGDK